MASDCGVFVATEMVAVSLVLAYRMGGYVETVFLILRNDVIILVCLGHHWLLSGHPP